MVVSSSLIIQMLDIHGLFGGRNIFILADGNVFVREVESGLEMKERRYHGKLSQEELGEIKQAIINVGFFGFRERKRAGIPDEARQSIYADFDRRHNEASKWQAEADPRFDLACEVLEMLADELSQQKPIWVGTYDACIDWPTGLTRN